MGERTIQKQYWQWSINGPEAEKKVFWMSIIFWWGEFLLLFYKEHVCITWPGGEEISTLNKSM